MPFRALEAGPAKRGFRPLDEAAASGPGEGPDSPLPEMPPEISTGDRASLQYHSRDADQLAERIRSEKGLEAQPTQDGNVAIKSPSTGKWHVINEPGFNWRDILDWAGPAQDVGASIVGGGLGLIGGGGVGSLALGTAGAAGGGALSKGLRTGSVQGAKEGAVEGAIGELGGAAISKGIQFARAAYKGAGRAAETGAQILEAPAKVQATERGLASLGTEREGLQGQRAALRAEGAGYEQEAQRIRLEEGRVGRQMGDVQAARSAEHARTAPVYAERSSAAADLGELNERMIQAVRARGQKVASTIKAGAQAAAASPSVAGATARGASGSGRTLISELLPDPAWGFKAEFLDRAPELQEILRRNFGDQIVPELGTRAMSHRDDFLRLIKSLDPKGYEAKAESYVKDMAHYLIGSAEFAAMSAEERQALVSVARGTANAQQAQVFKQAVKGKLANSVKVDPKMAAALDRSRQARVGAQAAKAEEDSAEIAYKDNIADLRAASARLRGQATEPGGPVVGKFALAGERKAIEDQAVNLSSRTAAMKAAREAVPYWRSGNALMGTGATAIGGAIGGVPGAIVGSTLGASGALARPMQVAAKAIRWISSRPHVYSEALMSRMPGKVQAAMRQTNDVLRKHGEKAAQMLLQALIRSDPDLERQISTFVR